MKKTIKSISITIFSAMSIFVLAVCSEPEANKLAPVSDSVINIAAIQGVIVPATGGTPVTAITANAQYSGTVTWVGNPYVFTNSTAYTAIITLTPNSGYTLQGVAANFFTVTGASTNNDANSGVIIAMFSATGGTAANPTVINMASIQGVTAPATGETPVTAITENSQYSGTIMWNGDPSTFLAATVYTATITLTPKTGYTLQGVTANFFTVSGSASVSNTADSGIVTAVFPATAPTSTTSVSIIIIAPVKGATPNTTASGVGNFTIGAVSWSPSDTPFLGNKVYTASVTLTANSGYTFAGLSSAAINGQSAEVSNNTGSTVTLSHTFPATDTKTVTKIAIKTQPGKLTYTHGDTLDLSGLAVTLTHDDLTTEDVDAVHFTAKNITANPAHDNNLVYLTNNGQPVKIIYGDLTCYTNNLTVNPKVITFTVNAITAHPYTGSPIEPPVTVKDGTTILTLTIDYTVVYTNNINAGTANVIIIGAGNYAGSSGSTTFTINATPTADDFNIIGIGTFIYDGNVKAVNITHREGKTTGAITVKYNGSTTAPSTAGEYAVTFDVAAVTGFSAVNGVPAGTLTIEKATPTLDDFNISGTGSVYYDGNSKTVNVSPKTGKTNGTITVKYNGSTTAPSAIGTYTVTFDVVETTNFNAASDLPAGTLIITPFTSIVDLRTYLQSRPNNTAGTAYIVALNINNLGGSSSTTGSLGKILKDSNKYVSLDLSGSTFSAIPNNAFEGSFSSNSLLTGIFLPNRVTSIGERAFHYCNSLTSVTIPDSVTSIGNDAFSGCSSLTTINVEATNTAYSSIDGVLYNKNKTTLLSYPEGKTGSFNIPNSVTSIEPSAFEDCTNLTSITIPNSVTSIGWSAFKNCDKLTSVTFQNTIASSNFSSDNPFPGDLRNKFYALNSTNGTPGTYTRASGGTVWTKQ